MGPLLSTVLAASLPPHLFSLGGPRSQDMEGEEETGVIMHQVQVTDDSRQIGEVRTGALNSTGFFFGQSFQRFSLLQNIIHA